MKKPAKAMKKIIILLCLLAVVISAAFVQNSVYISLFFRMHMHAPEILWDHVEDDYSARFVLAEANGSLITAVYKKSIFGWGYMMSNSDEDFSVIQVALYEKGQEKLADVKTEKFCLIGIRQKALEELYTQTDWSKQSESNIQCTSEQFTQSETTVKMFFGQSSGDFGSDDLIYCASPH
jgi:hypothetical protein